MITVLCSYAVVSHLCPEAQEFSKKFNEAMVVNGDLIGSPETTTASGEAESKAADELAAAVGKVEVA